MRLQPTYKAVIKKTHSRGKCSKHVQGGKVMTLDFIQTRTRSARKGEMLRLHELRAQ